VRIIRPKCHQVGEGGGEGEVTAVWQKINQVLLPHYSAFRRLGNATAEGTVRRRRRVHKTDQAYKSQEENSPIFTGTVYFAVM
jgi:hypothetical protein